MHSKRSQMARVTENHSKFPPYYIFILPWQHFQQHATQTLPSNKQKNDTKSTNYLEVLTHHLRTEL